MSTEGNTPPPTGGQTAYAQQGTTRTVMQPQVTTKMVPVPVQTAPVAVAPVVHTATAVPELVHMKYCACDECKSKGKGYVKKVEEPMRTPSNVACEKDLCQAAAEGKERMDLAKQDVDAAEARLDEFQKQLYKWTTDALKAEREAENAIDNLREINESISQVANILSNAPSQEMANIQTKLQQAKQAEDNAQRAAEEAATNVMMQTKNGEKFKIDADKAQEVLVNRNAEYTLALCRAAASCDKCKWFEDLNNLYKEKFAYKCKKCGWEGDFFDVDKHEAACTGEGSKMFNCEFGCGFKGDFDVVGQHEAYSCPLRVRAPPGPVMVAPQAVLASQPVQPVYSNQPSIYRSGTNIQTIAAPAQTTRLLSS